MSRESSGRNATDLGFKSVGGVPTANDGSVPKKGAVGRALLHAGETSIYRRERRVRRGKTTMTPRTQRNDQLDRSPIDPDVDECPGCGGTLFVEGSPDDRYQWRCHAGWCDILSFGPIDPGMAEVTRR